MKLCIDCKFFKDGDLTPTERDTCLHENAQCDGVRSIKYFTCTSMRGGICGRDAKLFEPKEAE